MKWDITCMHCNYQWVVEQEKQPVSVNCPACNELLYLRVKE